MDKSSISEFANNLLCLEINTIEKETMTGELMPTLDLALLNIAECYANFLWKKCGAEIRGQLQQKLVSLNDPASPESVPVPPPGEKASLNTDLLRLSPETFNCLSKVAIEAKAILKMEEKEYAVLERISNCSNTIIKILNKKAAEKMIEGSPNLSRLHKLENGRAVEASNISWLDFLQIRKIWEMGDERIVAQTVINVDGDVITRVSPWAASPGKEWLLQLHKDSTELGATSWRHLFQILGDIVGESIKKIFGSKA